ncbi:hypothetical protein ACJX0J_014287, partial [Zea mays]
VFVLYIKVALMKWYAIFVHMLNATVLTQLFDATLSLGLYLSISLDLFVLRKRLFLDDIVSQYCMLPWPYMLYFQFSICILQFQNWLAEMANAAIYATTYNIDGHA